MPEQFVARLDRQLAAGLAVSTTLLAEHLQQFFDAADAGLIAQYCDACGTPASSWSRPICLRGDTYSNLIKVSQICNQPIGEVIAILLASNPGDVYPEPEE